MTYPYEVSVLVLWSTRHTTGSQALDQHRTVYKSSRHWVKIPINIHAAHSLHHVINHVRSMNIRSDLPGDAFITGDTIHKNPAVDDVGDGARGGVDAVGVAGDSHGARSRALVDLDARARLGLQPLGVATLITSARLG